MQMAIDGAKPSIKLGANVVVGKREDDADRAARSKANEQRAKSLWAEFSDDDIRRRGGRSIGEEIGQIMAKEQIALNRSAAKLYANGLPNHKSDWYRLNQYQKFRHWFDQYHHDARTLLDSI